MLSVRNRGEFNYVNNPENRKFEEISNILDLLKDPELDDIDILIKALRSNIRWSMLYLNQYKNLQNNV